MTKQIYHSVKFEVNKSHKCKLQSTEFDWKKKYSFDYTPLTVYGFIIKNLLRVALRFDNTIKGIIGSHTEDYFLYIPFEGLLSLGCRKSVIFTLH